MWDQLRLQSTQIETACKIVGSLNVISARNKGSFTISSKQLSAREGSFRISSAGALDEEQVSELLDHRERVGDATGPHRVPDLVYFGFQFASNHIKSVCAARAVPERSRCPYKDYS